MQWTVIIEGGWCGFGHSDGLVPGVRLGVIRIGWCRGSLLAKMQHWQNALAKALVALRRHAQPRDEKGRFTGRTDA